MLFDLRGKRRRMVQAIYLALALLMGGGLVLFGIGGEVSGGLLNAFTGGGGESGNEQLEERIDRGKERLQQNPENAAALAELVRNYYALAGSQASTETGTFPPEARDELQEAAKYWERYLEAQPTNRDDSLAGVAIQIYTVLNQPKDTQEAAAVLAERRNDVPSYLQLVQAAAAAGDQRTADLAAQKAVQLAPKAQRKAVEKRAEELKNPAAEQQNGG
jgi:tetratricopeptide (TPR) repeat protein